MTPPTNTSPLLARLKRLGGFVFRLVFGLALLGLVPPFANKFLGKTIGTLPAACLAGLLTVLCFMLFVRATEGAWPRAFSLRRAPVELASGVLLGVVLSACSVAILYCVGAYQVQSVRPIGEWAALLVAALPIPILSGIAEEVAIRGVVTRQIARTFSPAAALVVSAVLFGLIHVGNPHASLSVGLGLVVQAGLLLGTAYLWTRRLWLPIGLHFAWNFMQAGVVGGALSGTKVSAIITATAQGPAWLSGGEFGIEGSLVSTLVCLTAAGAMFYAASKGGLRWRQAQTADGAATS